MPLVTIVSRSEAAGTTTPPGHMQKVYTARPVGARIEHPQEAIDHAMYGDYAGHPKLGHAEYQLSERETDTGRAVYTFCLCSVEPNPIQRI